MPFTPEQMRAIAAKMRRQGKSKEEISAFFRRHGHGSRMGGKEHPMMRAAKKRH